MEMESKRGLSPDDLLYAIKTRRSIRQFENLNVPLETVDRIIEAGRLTPTGSNAEDVSYVIMSGDMSRVETVAVKIFRKVKFFVSIFVKKFRRIEVDDNFLFKKAPLVITILSSQKTDGCLASANMALMAEACGLGVLYSGFFTQIANRSRKVKKLLGIKYGNRVAATLVLGYPNVNYRRSVQREDAQVRYV